MLGRPIQPEQSTIECQRAEIIPVGTLHLYNVASTSMQRHDVAWTLMRRCLSVMSLLGQIMKIPIYLRRHDSFTSDSIFIEDISCYILAYYLLKLQRGWHAYF